MTSQARHAVQLVVPAPGDLLLRFYPNGKLGGLSVDETAEVLGVSTTTVMRDWAMARAWLYRTMSEGASDEP